MAASAGVYRDHDETVRRRLEELASLRAEELLHPEMRPLERVYIRRRARLAGGIAGVAGGVALLVIGASSLTALAPPWKLLIGAWLGALVVPLYAYMAASAWASWVVRCWRHWLLGRTGSDERDLERLADATPLQTMREQARRFSVASIALPLMAIALLGPLTLHAPFALVGNGAQGFATWIGLSSTIVGHAHLVYAGLAARHAVKLGRDPHMTGGPGRTLAFTVAASCVPGILLLALPPILTAVTGALLIYTSYAWAKRTMLRESSFVAA